MSVILRRPDVTTIKIHSFVVVIDNVFPHPMLRDGQRVIAIKFRNNVLTEVEIPDVLSNTLDVGEAWQLRGLIAAEIERIKTEFSAPRHECD